MHIVKQYLSRILIFQYQTFLLIALIFNKKEEEEDDEAIKITLEIEILNTFINI